MPRLRVVFDTNAYVAPSEEEFQRLLQLERNCSIIGFASFWVVSELLAHVADAADAAFGRSLSALRRLSRHCTQYDGARWLTRFVADSEDHLCYTLFGQSLPGRDREAEAYGHLIGKIAGSSAPLDWRDEQPMLNAIRAHVLRKEREFEQTVWNAVVAPLVPDAKDWGAIARDPSLRAKFLAGLRAPETPTLAAGAIVDRTAASLGVSQSPDERNERVILAERLFPLPIRFMVGLLRKVGESGIDLSISKHSNSLWDHEIAFSTSPNALMHGTPIWLITTDSALIASARESNAESVVWRQSKYIRLLEDGLPSVNEIVAQRRGA